MIRVLLCEDNPDIRQLLAYQFEGRDIVIVGESGSCDGCETRALEAGADVILLDLSITQDDMGAIARLAQSAAVVVYSGYPAFAKEDECLEAGAKVYVEKRADVAELVDAITRAAQS